MGATESGCEWLVAFSFCWWLRGQHERGYSSVSCLGLLVPALQSVQEGELLVEILVLSEYERGSLWASSTFPACTEQWGPPIESGCHSWRAGIWDAIPVTDFIL